MRFLRALPLLVIVLALSILAVAGSPGYRCSSRNHAFLATAETSGARCPGVDGDIATLAIFFILVIWIGVPVLLGIVLARRGILFTVWRFK